MNAIKNKTLTFPNPNTFITTTSCQIKSMMLKSNIFHFILMTF